ncbi:KTSC domain-containing protein [Brevundimonas sp.]|uniref:KTSC domain-containing protein n=1 Tax=Brevundimonas sp. TaxID=1871086 RepID=UPI0028AE1763|nr:KTSC domain-containing protein [Brevundimonas sp.]
MNGAAVTPARYGFMPSTVIRLYSYDETARRLRVSFVSGAVYDYDDVPLELVEELAAAESKGRFFGSHIRDHFPYRRVFSEGGSSGARPGP